MGILKDENGLLGSVILPELVENGCLINFHFFYLPPPQHVNLFIVSIKNQARLTQKIVGSYLRVFTVSLSPDPKLMPCFSPFLKVFKSEFLIEDLTSRLIVNENEMSISQNLSLGVDNQKQIKF